MSFSISGEAKAVTEQMIAPWSETTLPTILSRYSLKDIFNADEFGLLSMLTQKALGWIPGMLLAKDFPCLLLGSQNLQDILKGVKNIPCRYRWQPKSWMSSDLFEEWVREIDKKFGTYNTRV